MTRPLPALEQRYRALFEETHDAVVLIGLDQRILDCNQRFLDMLGLDAADLGGLSSTDVMQPRERAEAQARFKRLLSGEKVPLYERLYFHRDGSEVVCEVNVSVVRDEGGAPLYLQSILRDITERRRAERALRESQQQLLNARRLESVGLLAGGIAHNFNNLLTSILGNLSLVRLDLEEGETLDQIDAAERATSRARALVQQLLTLAKGGAPDRLPCDIGELLHEVVSFSLGGTAVELEFTIDRSLSVVEVDRNQLSQVLENLAINAIQAMPDGGRLRVRAGDVELDRRSPLPLPAGRYVELAFEDTGIGIPPDDLQRIFDPYFTTKESGSGLGLATSYSIVRKHDGLLTAESTAGEGACFRVFLPTSDRTPTRDARPAIDAEGWGRILVMDDESDVLDTACALLRRLGYRPERASHGEEAIEIYERAMASDEPFRAVVLDLQVRGGMGGRATARRLTELDPDLFAIVSSGYSDEIEEAEADGHFSASLAKPYRIDEMREVMERVPD